MDGLKQKLLSQNVSVNDTYAAEIYNLNNDSHKDVVNKLLAAHPDILIHDELDGQLRELIKSLHPSIKIKAEEYPALIEKHLAGRDMHTYGVWVYYPWSHKLVHTLDEEEFTEIRTNRNRYKITREEQALLRSKKIGVIGLSVGQSIALTLAMERTCGELRLADFDTAELSNLNRIRTGLHNLGLKKTIIAAREIAEIDPFLKVKIFSDGIHTGNIDTFFEGDGKLDLLVEVCDGLDIKIVSRFKARALQIPVVMDTNDRGMLDVERFDLEPERPILHGLAGDLDPDKIGDLTNEEKIPYILKMVGAETISTRLKASMMEVEQSVNTWPQLASSVVLGGALTTDVCRRILLDQYHDSGRYYIDLDELVKDKEEAEKKEDTSIYDGPPELAADDMLSMAARVAAKDNSVALSKEQVDTIVSAGILAPSGGNAQPWKFLYHDNRLFLYHEEHYSYSLLDYGHLGSYVALGAVIENIDIKAAALGYGIEVDYFPLEENHKLVAAIAFHKGSNENADTELENVIGLRLTNRTVAKRTPLPDEVYKSLQSSIESYDGAQLHIVTQEPLMTELGEVLASTEMLRIIHPRGHYDTFTKELRWTEEENLRLRDGMDVQTLGVSEGEVAAFKIAEDRDAMSFLRDLHGGGAFKKMVRKGVAAASAIGIITMPEYSELNFVKGGRAVERVWLEANKRDVSFQPIAQLVFIMARLQQGKGEGLGEYFEQEFNKLKNSFNLLLPELVGKQPIFIFRLCIAGEPKVKSMRRTLESVLVRR